MRVIALCFALQQGQTAVVNVLTEAPAPALTHALCALRNLSYDRRAPGFAEEKAAHAGDRACKGGTSAGGFPIAIDARNRRGCERRCQCPAAARCSTNVRCPGGLHRAESRRAGPTVPELRSTAIGT